MPTLTLGDVEIVQLLEVGGLDFALVGEIFPDHDPAVLEANRAWLAPDHFNLESGLWRACVQSYLLRSEGRTILVDTGLGNHKERPYFTVGTHLDTDYLDRLAAVGVTPEQVDVVVSTHLHVDHVGWNTRLDGRAWLPTFPNATYLFAQADVDYWNPLGPGYGPTPYGRLINQNVYEDSVVPILEAGLATVWSGDTHRLDRNLVLQSAPGHTPGSAVLVLETGGDRALFVGDLMHSPLQAIATGTNSCFDEDGTLAAQTRQRIVARAADSKALILAPHFVGGEALEVTRNGAGFAFAGWRSFTD
jgi:glyoxylase-like metal-dependent hydrolase (beta-lactamase superfamily II)